MSELELIIKRFNELSAEELFDIYKLRISVFVVEQNCPYQEADDADIHSYHVYMKDKNGIQAYLRVVDANVNFPEVSIGRVIAVKRRSGLGSILLNEGIKVAKTKLNASSIRIEAQVYAVPFYEKAGFKRASAEYSEDGILHVQMLWNENR